jgi:hypothetical protein
MPGYAPHNLGLVDHREPLFPLFLLWNDSSGDGSYMQCDARVINLIKPYSRIEGNSPKIEATILHNIFFWIDHKIMNPMELVS